MFIGSSTWLDQRATRRSAFGRLWRALKKKAKKFPANDLIEKSFHLHVNQLLPHHNGWQIPKVGDDASQEILDENTFFPRFEQDISAARESIFGLVAFFGTHRWPRIEPLFSSALRRDVEVTLVTPPAQEAKNQPYVNEVIKHLRSLGAVVIHASGLHGKDVVIDGRIHYTGSLNWASHRGNNEIMHRTNNERVASSVLEFMQARYIRSAANGRDGMPRCCPFCGYPVQLVNQARPLKGDKQALKVGCSNPVCKKYLRRVDERLPFAEPPRCQVDGHTLYVRVPRGRGAYWQCPNHPRSCRSEKAIEGDPE